MRAECKDMIEMLEDAEGRDGTYAVITTSPFDDEIHTSQYGFPMDIAIGAMVLFGASYNQLNSIGQAHLRRQMKDILNGKGAKI